MPATQTEIRKFDGLYLQANSFDVPDGAMEVAENVFIQNDGIVSKIPGFYTYFETTSMDPVRSLFQFQNHLMGCFGGTMCYFNDDSSLDSQSPTGTKVVLSGDSFSVSYLSRQAQQNLNMYFTTDNGIFKLESYNGKVRKAGTPPALDITVLAGTSATGPLPADSQTAFRCVFGRRDTNGNLLLGAPSDITTVGIPLDGTGLTYTSVGAGPYTVTLSLPSNSGSYAGQQLIITNGTSANINGTQTILTIATPSTTNVTFSVSANPGNGTCDVSFSRTALLTATVPSEIDALADEYFVQWYRTTSSASLSVSPTPDFALVGEQQLTALDLSTRVVNNEDDVDPTLIGAQLYTNPNSREGEQQANFRPPQALDITLYNTYMMYANVQTIPTLSLQLIDPNLPVGYTFKLKYLSTESFVAVNTGSGVGNQTVKATSIAGTGTVTITYAAHGASNGWTVYISSVTGSVPRGTYTISGVTANTFAISSLGNTATALSFEFVTNGTDAVFSQVTTGAISTQVLFNAIHLVKAINRVSSVFYANYTSTFDDIPGKIRISTRGIPGVTFYVADNNVSTSINYWLPPIPGSFSVGTQVYSDNCTLPDAIYFSKTSESEAVPVVNFVRIGSKNKAIKRIFDLRDCLVILKEDGAFVLSGQTISDFSVSTLDATVFFSSDTTASKINNAVIAMSNQGLVQVTEKSVQIISRRIDDVIQPIVFSTSLLDVCLGFGFETQRLFYLSITDSFRGRSPVTWLYNVLNNSWTSTDLVFKQMVIGPSGICYGITPDDAAVILRQRAGGTLIDYSREFVTISVLAAADQLSATVTLGTYSATFTPAEGDVIVYNEVISRIRSFIPDNLGAYTVTFDNETNIPSSGAVDAILYQGFTSTIKMAPFHAGMVGREKMFTDFQLHLRQNSISEVNIRWASAFYGSSDPVDWSDSFSGMSASAGWGYMPWGLFPWGLSNSIYLSPGTTTGVPIRTWVSIYAARSTFIQAIIRHRQACEQILIQSLSYTVRGLGNRTSK